MWDAVGETKAWEANKYFLDTVAALGDDIHLSIPKGSMKKPSYLEKEIVYLLSKGYKWVNQWVLRKPVV